MAETLFHVSFAKAMRILFSEQYLILFLSHIPETMEKARLLSLLNTEDSQLSKLNDIVIKAVEEENLWI